MLWLAGSTYNLTAPSTTLWNGSTYFFDYWYGTVGGRLLFTNGSSVAGTIAGGERVEACYTLPKGGTCHLPGAPGFLGVSVDPSYALVTVNGVALSSASGSDPIPESPGTYWVNASAPGYFPSNRSVSVTPGDTTWANLSLTPIQGTLAGSVDPTNALVSVNGTSILVRPDGSFGVSLLPGTYTVDVSAWKYSSYTNPSVRVTSSNTTFLAIVLAGLPGWINGTVTPAASAAVTLNDQFIPSDPATGAFSERVSPGVYWVNGSATGYLPAGSGPLTMDPFGSISVTLSLTEILGTLSGLVVPVAASVAVDGTPVATSDGLFALDLVPAPHVLTASASGYDPFNVSVDIRFNETTRVVLTLNVSNGWILGTVAPANARLEVDGRSVGLGIDGAFNTSLSPGAHHLRVSSDGYVTSDRNVTVDAGRATHVLLTLDAVTSAGSTLPSYILPIGLIAAAAVVVLIAAILRRRRRRPTRVEVPSPAGSE
jgi:hypothetical protein